MWVSGGLPLTPKKQRIFGWFPLGALRIFFVHIDNDFVNLEAENDGPNETEDKSGIAINDIFRTDALQTNLISGNVQSISTVYIDY